MLLHEPENKTRVSEDLFDTNQLRIHFSQCGEDAILWHYLSERTNGFYVDVGCHHPYRFSNTALFSTFRGWRGINIDLDKRAIAAFQSVRPNDINLNMAIGPEEDRLATIFQDGAVNSLDSAAAIHQSTLRPVEETIVVNVRPLSTVLAEHLPVGTHIDLMNIDPEGWDHVILETNDWSLYRPEFIAVESHGFDLNNPSANATFRFLRDQGYSLISYAVVTAIFQRPAR